MAEWREVVGFPAYEVSDMGAVRSKTRYLRTHRVKGNYESVRQSQVLKFHKNPKGYLHSNLRRGGKSFGVLLHRLVAEAFIPNPDNKPFINHKNTIKDDNRVENLEWCTNQENVNHAVENKLVGYGESASAAKLKTEDVLVIRELYRNGTKPRHLMARFQISKGAFWHIIWRKTWKHL